MKLADLGWSGFFEEQLSRWSGSGLIPGRITGEAGYIYKVESEKIGRAHV